MKKYSSLFGVLTILFLFGALLAPPLAASPGDKRRQILEERIRRELSAIERRLATVRGEHDAAARKYLATLSTHKKLQLLERSARYHKERCLWFDDECRRLYDMTLIYLTGELALIEERMAPEREEALAAANDHAALKKRFEMIGTATLPDSDELPATYEVAELRGEYRCVPVEGWNPARGVFVEADRPFDLPFAAEVTATYREGNAKFIAAAFRDLVIQYAYTGEPAIFPGEIAPAYTPLFEKPDGNPVIPGTVLISLLRKGRLIDPSFLCRH